MSGSLHWTAPRCTRSGKHSDCVLDNLPGFRRREAHTNSNKAEAETRRVIQASIAELEDGGALLKDYSWLMKVGCNAAALTTRDMQGRSDRSQGTERRARSHPLWECGCAMRMMYQGASLMQSLRGIYPACLTHSYLHAIIHILPDIHSVSLVQAQDQLVHARRILGYSYVFAFYMFGQVMFAEEVSAAQNAINQNLFEDQQQQLEHMVRSF